MSLSLICASPIFFFQELELKNVNLRPGDKLKVKGEILHDAERFQIDLGLDSEDLALHFNPHYHDDADGAVLVCNSKTAGCWGDEKREIHNLLLRGSEVKVRKCFKGKLFTKIKCFLFQILPDGQEMQFPNRADMDVITYIRAAGDFKLTSFKIC
uniref:Galectin n=1 Tax=Cyprinodon variegatus TaxID=28743 RepID=A0A3Q2CRN9_CYPVA